MPQNKLLYIGLLIVAAAACIYIGAVIADTIRYAVPYAVGVGALLIIAGLVMEGKKKKKAATTDSPPTTP